MKREHVCMGRVVIAALLGAVLLFAACPTDGGDDTPTGEPDGVSYTVTFTAGTGSGTPPAPMTVTRGTAITLPDQGSMIPPEDSVFDGWRTGDIPYTAGTQFTVNAAAEFTAQWKSAIDPNKTYVEFENLEQFPVIIYSDSFRETESARVPAEGKALIESDPKPQGTVFYPRFLLEFEGIPLSYDGAAVMIRVDEKKVNKTNIPRLSSIETGSAFIKIENKSASSLTFTKGSSELPALGTDSTIVMPTESAGYRIEPGAKSQYRAMKNGSAPIVFPGAVTRFEAETLYSFVYDGNVLTLSGTQPLMQALSLLPAPASVSVSVLSASSISLAWAAVEKAASYKVYRSSALDGDYAFLATVNASPYTGDNLSGGTGYYYKVQALSAERESPLSAACAILILPAVPGLAAQVEDAASISLSWAAVTEAGEYKVYRSSGPDAEYQLLDTVSVLTYTDGSVSPGTPYTYRVQAVDPETAGASPFATLNARILAPVQNISTLVESAASVSLRWEPVEGATTYKLYRTNPPDTDFALIQTLTEQAYTDHGLSEGSAYAYKVQGANAQGDGVLSAAAPVKILPAPQGLQVQAATAEARITLTWSAADGASSYQVYRSTFPDKDFVPVATTTSLSYTDEDLNEATTYYYSIRALNMAASGESPLSAPVSTATPVLSAISNLTYSSVSGGEWTVQSDGSRKSPSISYGSMTKARVSFTSHVANASVTIQLRVYSYGSSGSYDPSYNYAFISTLDNAAATRESGYYSGSRISGRNSVSITIPVPSPGNHFIDIGYQKGNTTYETGEDCAWFTVTNY